VLNATGRLCNPDQVTSSQVIGDILQPTHLLFILVIALLVLGPKRLPEVGRSLGRGLRDFRHAISGQDEEPGQPAIEAAQNGETPAPPVQGAATVSAPVQEAATAPAQVEQAATMPAQVPDAATVPPPVPQPATVPPAQEPTGVSAEPGSTGSS
jgi:sec-independent protein translocase protein TatA